MSKVKMPLARARQLAEALVADLTAGCERIEVAGSVRRRRPEVGDIEIVAIPRPSLTLFGEPEGTQLDGILERLQGAGHLCRIKGGDKYKQFGVTHPQAGDGEHVCNLDLFLTTADQWGLILLIRTGPQEFSRRFVTKRHYGGLLPYDLRVAGGRLWRGVDALPTPEEIDCFRLAGLEWVEPWERS